MTVKRDCTTVGTDQVKQTFDTLLLSMVETDQVKQTFDTLLLNTMSASAQPLYAALHNITTAHSAASFNPDKVTSHHLASSEGNKILTSN